jgi:[2Fe-2S] binding domain/FAD binding domain in molybdopterin dehydrogenase
LLQERLANAHGSQCGFCTPGFVMSMYALLRSAKGPITQQGIEDALAGNLCRCTGYRPILDAFEPFTGADHSVYTNDAVQRRAAAAAAAAPKDGATNGATNGETGCNGTSGHTNGNGKESGKICPSTGKPCGCSGGNEAANGKSNGAMADAPKQAPPCEPIFPPKLASGEHVELALPGSRRTARVAGIVGFFFVLAPWQSLKASPVTCHNAAQSDTVADHCLTAWHTSSAAAKAPSVPNAAFCTHLQAIAGIEVSWYRPLTLDRLLELAAEHPRCKFVGGNTEVGIETKIGGQRYGTLVDPTFVPELTRIEETDAGLKARAFRWLDIRNATARNASGSSVHGALCRAQAAA